MIIFLVVDLSRFNIHINQLYRIESTAIWVETFA